MEIAKVDLCGLMAGGVRWEAARTAVTASMVAHGCVIVVAPDVVGPDLHQALFSRVLPELFMLPFEVKQRMASTKGEFQGYIGRAPGMEWDSFALAEPTDAAIVQGFAETLWPEGNSEFRETIVSFAKNMLKLEEMVETLALEGLGVHRESIGAHFNLLTHSSRLSHYSVPPDAERSMALGAHRDGTILSAIVQHEVEGLEVLIGDEQWVSVPPELGTIIFIAGDLFRVVTNGRVPGCLHRVMMSSNRERFSVQFASHPPNGVVVHALEDLVDAENPLVYNPLRHEEYFKWRYSEAGRKFEDPLKAYYRFVCC